MRNLLFLRNAAECVARVITVPFRIISTGFVLCWLQGGCPIGFEIRQNDAEIFGWTRKANRKYAVKRTCKHIMSYLFCISPTFQYMLCLINLLYQHEKYHLPKHLDISWLCLSIPLLSQNQPSFPVKIPL